MEQSQSDRWRDVNGARATLARAAVWALGVAALDLSTKHLVRRLGVPIERNRNFALGFGSETWNRALVMGLAFLFLLFLAHLTVLAMTHRLRPEPYGLATGGLAANWIDRLTAGFVTDWIAVGPVVLNIADVAVFLGIAFYIRSAWKSA